MPTASPPYQRAAVGPSRAPASSPSPIPRQALSLAPFSLTPFSLQSNTLMNQGQRRRNDSCFSFNPWLFLKLKIIFTRRPWTLELRWLHEITWKWFHGDIVHDSLRYG